MSDADRQLWRPRWEDGARPVLSPGDLVCFADLEGPLDGTGVELFGCVLSDASLAGDPRIVGCFAAGPVTFEPSAELVRSHLPNAGQQWPVPVAAAAGRAVTGDNLQRYEAAAELGTLGYQPAAPFLAWLLDDEEWDVRSAAVQSLTALRGAGFPDRDEMIVRAVIDALGDENPIVSMHATDFLEAAQAPPPLYANAVAAVRSPDVHRVVTALRVVVALSRADDPHGTVAATFDGAALVDLLRSPYGVVRAEYLHALGAADQYVPRAWRAALADDQSGVRAQALTAIRLLDDPPAGELSPLVEQMLRDKDESVRAEALFALGHLGRFDRGAVSAALDDPSEQIRVYAAQLLSAEAQDPSSDG